MFDTLKLIYTQDEALELVSRYEKVYNEKIEELEEENKKLKEEIEILKTDRDEWKLLNDMKAEDIKKLKEKLEKWEKDYKEGIIVHCRNG